MAEAILVGPSIEEGRRFIELLENAEIPITAALWQWNGFLGSDFWELDLASPLVEKLGLRETYLRVFEILRSSDPPVQIDTWSINLFRPNASFVKSLRRSFKGQKDRTVRESFVDDHVIEHGYLYFVK
jgi:hypothetical protein